MNPHWSRLQGDNKNETKSSSKTFFYRQQRFLFNFRHTIVFFLGIFSHRCHQISAAFCSMEQIDARHLCPKSARRKGIEPRMLILSTRHTWGGAYAHYEYNRPPKPSSCSLVPGLNTRLPPSVLSAHVSCINFTFLKRRTLTHTHDTNKRQQTVL